MNENSGRKRYDPYYDYFKTATKDGKVFVLDLSSDNVDAINLTEPEKNERKQWKETVTALENHYYDPANSPPVVSDRESLLQQRLVAPILGWKKVSSRSKPGKPRKGRMYPPTIQQWGSFANEVENFEPEKRTLPPYRWTVFLDSLGNCADTENDEEREQASLVSNLRRNLVKAGIVYSIQGAAGVGKIDFHLLKAEPAGDVARSNEIAVIGESKTTHNLLLPTEAINVAQKYNAAYKAVISDKGIRPVEWFHICHPLAQLLGYMADNGRRYGALTSGTRTYFIYISGSGDSSAVHVSDAWFVGQKGYLRAWAFIHHKGCKQTDVFAPPDWTRTDKDSQTPQASPPDQPPPSPPTPRSDDDEKPKGHPSKRQRRGSGRHGGTIGAGSIPSASFNDIDIVEVVGSGRNGAVFRVHWEGKEAAMKQFDIGRDGDEWFENELGAYLRLKEVWGILVPKPMFLSESVSGGVKFLGLQLGRDPREGDDLSQWPRVLRSLEKHGIRHNDCWRRNCLFITDDTGSEQLVAIDLEDYEELSETA